ncbi:MAG: hypothetical protein DRJ47_11245, partial [Thermoprotei archaeon]
RQDPYAARKIDEILRNMCLAFDKLELSKIRVDLLRRVYQEFFDPETRKALGEFYTNERIVNEVLDAVGYSGKTILDKTLLDPACGSGTFLIVAIQRFIREGKEAGLTNVELLERITEQILGMDIHPFAVAMAKVNYLLAISELIEPSVRKVLEWLPIPIYWTDSLASFTVRPEPTGLPVLEVDVTPLGKFRMPDPKEVNWFTLLDKLKEAVDSGWSGERFLNEFPETVRLKYRATLLNLYDSFKRRAMEGKDSRWLSTLRNVIIVDAYQGRCDFVVGNPPWVRIHNVNEELRKRIASKFNFYGKKASWNPRLKRTKVPFRMQVDYSLAFVEAALKFLKDGGVFGFVITSNVVRSLYAGAMRKTLIAETTILSIVDYSLSRVQLFEKAQNAPLILVFKKGKPPDGHCVKVSMVNRLEERRTWLIPQSELPLYKEDPASPWLIAPFEVVKIMRKMQKAGPRIGDVFTTNMGIKTAANDIFFVKRFEPTDEVGIVLAETEGGDTIRIEKEVLRPLVRGKDVDAWHYKVEDYIIWTHDDEGKVLPKLPPNAKHYFGKKNIKEKLIKRNDYRKNMPYWTIFRVSAEKLKDKVTWQDIEKTIKAVFIPSQIFDTPLRDYRKTIVDHTVYFISVDTKMLGYLLAAFLNSTPVKAYVASYVMRTGAVYCHYLGWYMGVIPIPDIAIKIGASELVEVSKILHQQAGRNRDALRRLDEIVASLYGLSLEELKLAREFLEFFIAG